MSSIYGESKIWFKPTKEIEMTTQPGIDALNGLSEVEAKKRLKETGYNELPSFSLHRKTVTFLRQPGMLPESQCS